MEYHRLIRCNRIGKIFIGSMLFIYILVYVIYLEPYCFFTTPLYSNELSKLAQSKIYSERFTESQTSNRNLIVILTPKSPLKLIERIKLIDNNLDDDFTTNILFIQNSDFYKSDVFALTKTIKRPILFLNIGNIFSYFPIGFDACKTKTTYRYRGKWNYQLMIRFWFKTLFQLPQLREYQYILRLDDDSQMIGKWINVFEEMRRKNAVYFANNEDIDFETILPGTMNLKRITFEYIKQHKIIPRQPKMLNEAFGNGTIKNYFNNFEVAKMDFFRRPDVLHWIENIDSTHGIFKYRWGDAILRYLTIALFADQQQVLHRTDYNLSYCHKC